MKKLILALLFGFFAAPLASAQSSEFEIQQVNQLTGQYNHNSLLVSEDLIGLFANSPLLATLQELAIDANQIARIDMQGDENTATLAQSGFHNIGIIFIEGNHNQSSLIQHGNGLFSGINIIGDYNNLDVEQRGTALQNLILLNGDGLQYDILQNNDGVQLTQTGAGIPLQIRSTGRRVPIMITNQ